MKRPKTAGEVFFPDEPRYKKLADRRWKAMQESWKPVKEKLERQFAESLAKAFKKTESK